MAFSPRAVRGVLVGVATVLVAVVLGFIGYAHYRAQNFLLGLPKKLGIDIRQETDNVTYSQSYGGRTIFTVHAAKQIQHQDGKYTLKDVGIILYGRDGDHQDKIHGSEFEFDQKAGVLTAVGDVYLDLTLPAAKNTGKSLEEDRVVHVKTSGLTYLQKERTATTEKEIVFSAGGMTGQALGASYDGATGVVILNSAVKASGVRDGKPMLLTAGRAELDRTGNLSRLQGAHFVTTGSRGNQVMAADHAIVRMSHDGTPEHVDADGSVLLSGDGKGKLTGQRLDADFNEAGQMRAAHVAGAVHFVQDSTAHAKKTSAVTASTDDLRVAFDAAGRPLHASLTGAVALEQKALTGMRTLRSGRLEVALNGGGKQPLVLRGAQAYGPQGATLKLADDAAKVRGGTGHTEMEMRADTLVARFAAANALSGLEGHGHSSLQQVVSTSAAQFVSQDVSTGDELKLDLRAGEGGRTELVRGEQHGSVVVDRTAAARKPGEPQTIEHARAADAVFEADANRLLLSGAVQVSDESSVLLADRVALDRGSGVATADGAVKVSYTHAGSAGEPIHVQATQAIAHKDTGVTEFTAAGGLVRMWQAGSQVEAPVIDLNRTEKTVVARGPVRAVLVGAPGKDGVAVPVRVSAAAMRYVDASRTVELKGMVRVDQADGRMTADSAVLTLAAPAAGAKPVPGFLGGGRVERVVSTGAVQIQQPGRKATGERLVYTAADGVYVLTGTKAAPPRVTDAVRGTIAGAQIRFTGGEDSVVVTGGESGRVRTETRVKQ